MKELLDKIDSKELSAKSRSNELLNLKILEVKEKNDKL